MALDPIRNFAISRVATVPSPADSGTSLVVDAGDGALFPDPSSSGAFNVVIYPNGEQPDSSNAEIVRVTARSTDTMTITREQEGTSARTIEEGDVVMMGITRKVMEDIQDIAEHAIPAGVVEMFGGSTAPTGYLLCDGTAVSRTTYSALFTAISTTYGVGDGSTTFNLPDFRGIFPKGAGTTTRAAGVDGNGSAYTATLGTYSQDKLQGHRHNFILSSGDGSGSAYGQTTFEGGTLGYNRMVTSSGAAQSEFRVGDARTGDNGTLREGNLTEPQNLGINFIIKT